MATTWSDLDVGENTFVFEYNVIQPFVKIGNNVVLWSGNHIGHHVVIADHCFITSHVVISGATVIAPDRLRPSGRYGPKAARDQKSNFLP